MYNESMSVLTVRKDIMPRTCDSSVSVLGHSSSGNIEHIKSSPSSSSPA